MAMILSPATGTKPKTDPGEISPSVLSLSFTASRRKAAVRGVLASLRAAARFSPAYEHESI